MSRNIIPEWMRSTKPTEAERKAAQEVTSTRVHPVLSDETTL